MSGTPFTITGSGSYLNARGNTQVADRVPGVDPMAHGRTYLPGVVGYRHINPAAFRSVTAANSTDPRFGTFGGNSVRGPGFFDLDASLKRTFPIRENIALDLLAESFDVTNAPQFANPGTVGINSVSAQPVTSGSQPGGVGIIT